MAIRALGTEERVPGLVPGGEERHSGSLFGQQERTTESLPERNDIVMCSCCVNEERTRKICVLSETRNVTNCGGSYLWDRKENPRIVSWRRGKEHRIPLWTTGKDHRVAS